MNPDLNSSPLTSAQSWIVENISSLISSNLDDENDCTLTMPNENRSSKLSLSNSDDNSSPEVARTLAVADEHFALGSERLGKRPFSPELIFPEDTANAIDNCEQLQMFYNNNKLFSQMNQNRLNQFDEFDTQTLPLKPFPTSSSFYDDLNLEDCNSISNKSNKFLSNFMNMPTLQPPGQMPQHQPGSRDSYLTQKNGFGQYETTSVKKKKLTNYSLSSSNLPMVSVTDTNGLAMNNSASMPSFNDDDLATKNLSNSSYNSSFGSSMVSSSSYSSQLNNCYVNRSDAKSQQSMSYEKLFGLLMKGNENGQAVINDEASLGGNKWSNGYNKAENGNTLTAQQQDFINSSYYDLMKRSNFNDMQKHQQQQGLTEVHSYNPYQSSLADPNQLSWKIEPSIIESFKNHHQQQQHQAAGKFQKKITKSSTTLFNQESHSSSQAQKQGQYFPHSTSYDNMACLNKLKPLKPLVNEFMSASASNDFLLESSFNNTSGNSGANRSAYYSSLNMSNKSKAG